MNLFARKLSLSVNSVYAIAGNSASQALLLISAPVLTRLYTPEDFGIFSIYVSVVTFLSVFVFLKYELAIPISNSLSNTLSVLKLCFMLGVLICSAVFAVLYFLADDFFELFTKSNIDFPLWTVPVAIFGVALMNLCRFWLVKAGRFDIMAISRGLVVLVLVAVQLVGGFLKVGSIGLIVGHLIGTLFTVLTLVGLVFKKYLLALRSVRIRSIKIVVKKYLNFPKYIVLSDSLLTIGIHAAPVIIASTYSITYAGFFALAYRVALAPVALVAESCGKVFMSRALALRGDPILPSFVSTSYMLLVRVAIIPFLLIALLSDDLVTFIFGNDWRESGRYIALLIPSIAAIFIFVPIMTLFLVLERQKMELRFQTFILIFRMLGLVAGIAMGDIYWAILSYSLFACAGYVITGCWIMGRSGVGFLSIMRITFSELLFSILLVVPIAIFMQADMMIFITNFWHNTSFLVLLALTAGCWIYRVKSSFKSLRKFDDPSFLLKRFNSKCPSDEGNNENPPS